jgi:pilus assembly protein CpaC
VKTLFPFVLIVVALNLRAAEAPAPIQIPVGKSMVIDTPSDVERVAVAAADIVDAIAISRREVVLNAKAPGETRVLVWQRNGGERLTFDVVVQPSATRLEALRQHLRAEVGEGVEVEQDEKSVILRGTVQNPVAVERAVALAAALGQPVNLLNVATPAAEPQVLLKVRFADIDRSASTELGANFISTGAGNTPGRVTTQQFSPPSLNHSNSADTAFNLSDALNIFLFRPDLNLGATIRALQAKNLVQILAEPNLLASAGKQASFLTGGEFPYPVVQSSGSGYNNVTIMFREFGIRINFVPSITPRGTIHLHVAPEVSSLDYANGLVYQGFNIPGLAVRRVQTDVELEPGQSFAIAGLLDNRVTDQFSKIPGLGDIPFFGKLFQSRSVSRNKSELLVVVTPELVQLIASGSKLPELQEPRPFLKEGAAATPDGNPPAAARLPVETQIPWELTAGEGDGERNSASNRGAFPPAGKLSDTALRQPK